MNREIITLLRFFAKHRYNWAAIMAALVLSVVAFDSIDFEFTSRAFNVQLEAKKNS